MLKAHAQETVFEDGWLSRTVKLSSDRDGREWTLRAAVPERFADIVSDRPDNFLSMILAFGMVRNEQVDLAQIPTDATQMRNLNSLFSVLGGWRPQKKYIRPIPGPVIPETEKAPGVASFYSGGIDSLFGLVRHTEGRSALPYAAVERDIDYAIHMLYLDELCDLDEIENTTKSLREGAEALGATFVPVITNFYIFDEEMRQWWGKLGFGAGMGCVLHFLSGGIGTGLIGSTHGFHPLDMAGANPVTDRLLGSKHLTVIHDGATYNRVEKTEIVATSPAALTKINVCDKLVPGVGYVNCSHCEKCMRTMVTLDLFGKADAEQCPSFDWSDYKVADIEKLFLKDQNEQTFAQEVVDAAKERGRDDIVQAFDQAFRRSSRYAVLGVVEKKLRQSSFGRKYRGQLRTLRANFYRRANMRVR